MKIFENIAKYMITAGICLFGASAFANTLSAVEVYQNGNGGKILLNAAQKPVVKKINVSDNEITLKLDNTAVSANLTSNSEGSENVSVMQDGNSTFVTVSGNNIADYKILNASDNSLIPTTNGSNTAIIISSLLFLLSLGFMSSKKKQYGHENKRLKSLKAATDIKTDAEKSMLNDLQTLRNKTQSVNTSSIHGNPVLRFSNNSINPSVSVPEGLKSSVSFGKNAVYLKTAVNS